jgi:tyrosyl-tRNA synthetase
MSISDRMMWRYYELLTDVQMADIEGMKREAHPMQAKKDLAARIVKDFHSAEASTKAAEDWAKQFQKNEVPQEIEEVLVNLADVMLGEEDLDVAPDGFAGFQAPGMGPVNLGIRLDRLLVICGMADSSTDAARKIKAGSVRIIDQSTPGLEYVQKETRTQVTFNGSSAKLHLRVGRKLKIVTIQRTPISSSVAH